MKIQQRLPYFVKKTIITNKARTAGKTLISLLLLVSALLCLAFVSLVGGSILTAVTPFLLLANSTTYSGQQQQQSASAESKPSSQDIDSATQVSEDSPDAATFEIIEPDPSTLGGGGSSFSGPAIIDHDGDPHAYAPEGSELATSDYLANAGQPGNWWGIQTDDNGNPKIGDDGYYISTTSLQIDGKNLNASTTAYVALPDGYGGAHLGDYVLITNNDTGKQVWAIYGDNRGSKTDGVEMSAAAAQAVGVNFNKSGTTSNGGNITVTVYPGSARKRS